MYSVYVRTYVRPYVWSLCLSARAAKSGYGSQTQRLGKDSLRVSVVVKMLFHCRFVVLYSRMDGGHESYICVPRCQGWDWGIQRWSQKNALCSVHVRELLVLSSTGQPGVDAFLDMAEPHSCNGYNCIDDGMTEWRNDGMEWRTILQCLYWIACNSSQQQLYRSPTAHPYSTDYQIERLWQSV